MFQSRTEAGKLLADKLRRYQNNANVVVLALPRGGVPVAKVLSERLNCPLGALITKKIGAPYQEELAIGAVGPGGEKYYDQELIQSLNIGQKQLKSQTQKAAEKVRNYQKKFPTKLGFKNKTVILVDDGIATGATVKVAVEHLKKSKAKKIILAVPVAPHDSFEKFKGMVDELVVLEIPRDFFAVGQFYQDFPQLTDAEVLKLLQE